MYRETCEATHVRDEQSAEVLDLRMSCLQERLGGLRALTDVFAEANGEVVENAVSAANALGSLDRCADVPLLRSVVRPPEDPATRARVAELRRRLAAAEGALRRRAAGTRRSRDAPRSSRTTRARSATSRWSPRRSRSTGTMYRQGERPRTRRRDAAHEAYWAADASHHDEVRAEVGDRAGVGVGYQEGALRGGGALGQDGGGGAAAPGRPRAAAARGCSTTWAACCELRGDRAAESLRAARGGGWRSRRRRLGAITPTSASPRATWRSRWRRWGATRRRWTHVDRSIDAARERPRRRPPRAGHAAQQPRRDPERARAATREARASFERARVIWERELGLDDRNLAYALTGIGLSYLAEGDPRQRARAARARVQDPRGARDRSGAARGDAVRARARAVGQRRDRPRARSLAEQARDGYAKAEVKTKVAEVDVWLRVQSAT